MRRQAGKCTCPRVRRAVQCSAVKCSAVPVQCSASASAAQCSAVQRSEVQRITAQCSAAQYSAVQCSAVPCRAVPFRSVPCSRGPLFVVHMLLGEWRGIVTYARDPHRVASAPYPDSSSLLHAKHSAMFCFQALVDTALGGSGSALSNAVSTSISWELRSGEWSACKSELKSAILMLRPRMHSVVASSVGSKPGCVLLLLLATCYLLLATYY